MNETNHILLTGNDYKTLKRKTLTLFKNYRSISERKKEGDMADMGSRMVCDNVCGCTIPCAGGSTCR